MLSPQDSVRLTCLRFPLIIGVLLIHSADSVVLLRGTQIGIDDLNGLAAVLRNLLSNEIARSAVPAFFLVSGYLFGVGFDGSRNSYVSKLRSRTGTLLIPFLIWNVVVLVVIAAVQSTPPLAQLMSGRKEPLSNASAWDLVCAVLGIGRAPIAYQFWFIRDLILLVLASPLLLALVRRPRLGYTFLLAIGTVWFWSTTAPSLPSVEALLFFSLGLLLQSHGRRLLAIDGLAALIVPVYGVCLALQVWPGSPLSSHALHQLCVGVGVAFALVATRLVLHSASARACLMWLSPASFFVFAAHEPLLTAVRKIGFLAVRPSHSLSFLFLYLAVPALVATGLVVAFTVLRRLQPRLADVLTGGRGQ